MKVESTIRCNTGILRISGLEVAIGISAKHLCQDLGGAKIDLSLTSACSRLSKAAVVVILVFFGIVGEVLTVNRSRGVRNILPEFSIL